MLLLLRFFVFFVKIQKNVIFNVFLLCFTRFLELYVRYDDHNSTPNRKLHSHFLTNSRGPIVLTRTYG